MRESHSEKRRAFRCIYKSWTKCKRHKGEWRHIVTDVHTITNLLREVRGGEPEAVDRLMCAVYPELHNIARRAMSHERAGHTLQPTALVHEAYLKLFSQRTQPNLSP
jgi:ECF sigma factor